MKIKRMYPNGATKAFTMSYDDGVTQDIRLVEILNKNGIFATFNLTSGKFGRDSFTHKNITVNILPPETDFRKLYSVHEIAVHSLTHPHLDELPRSEALYEITQDKYNLEQIAGYPILGMAYPYGTYNQTVISVLEQVGMVYARTVDSHRSFALPKNFLTWDPSCHHDDPDVFNLIERFKSTQDELALFYIWGHSYEFDGNENWDDIERICSEISGRADIWYATNIDIANYLNALKSLAVLDNFVKNNSALPLWFLYDGELICLQPGGEFIR